MPLHSASVGDYGRLSLQALAMPGTYNGNVLFVVTLAVIGANKNKVTLCITLISRFLSFAYNLAKIIFDSCL